MTILSNPESIHLVVDKEDKRRFKEACFHNGETMSRTLRAFMREYSKQSGLELELDSTMRSYLNSVVDGSRRYRS